MTNKEIKLLIIENYIDWLEHDEVERERMKNEARGYVEEAHVDELRQSLAQEKVTLEDWSDGTWGLYDENGMCIEGDFAAEEEAIQWAKDNDYEIVQSFNI